MNDTKSSAEQFYETWRLIPRNVIISPDGGVRLANDYCASLRQQVHRLTRERDEVRIAYGKVFNENAALTGRLEDAKPICICEQPDYEGQPKLDGGWDKDCPVHGDSIARLQTAEQENAALRLEIANARELSAGSMIILGVKVSALTEALRKLTDKLKDMETPVNNCIAISAVHGMPYNGPNWSEELAEAEALLAGETKP